MLEPTSRRDCTTERERDQALAERDRLRKYLREMSEALRVGFDFEATTRERDQALAERDEAIAERDYMLKFLQDLGSTFTSQRLKFCPMAGGAVEVRSVYRSYAAAVRVSQHIRTLRAMVCVAGSVEPPIVAAALAACETIAAAEQTRC